MTARRQGHRDPRLQHLRRDAGRHRRPAEGRRHQPAEVVHRAARRGGVPPQREHRVQGRLRRHEEPAAVVAPDARVVPVRHQQQRHGGRHVRLGDHAGDGHPGRHPPRHVVGQGRPAQGRLHPLAQPEQVDRGTVQQWNVSFERRLPYGHRRSKWRTSARRPTAGTRT